MKRKVTQQILPRNKGKRFISLYIPMIEISHTHTLTATVYIYIYIRTVFKLSATFKHLVNLIPSWLVWTEIKSMRQAALAKQAINQLKLVQSKSWKEAQIFDLDKL